VRDTGQNEHRGQADGDRFGPGADMADTGPARDPGGDAADQQGDQRSHGKSPI
jgi:hypothetical protein